MANNKQQQKQQERKQEQRQEERKQEQKQQERKQEQRQEQRQEQKQQEQRKEERQNFVAAVNKIDPGSKLGTKELEQLTNKTKLTPEEVLRRIEKTTDIKIPTRVSNRVTAGTTTTTTTVTPDGEVRGADGLTDAERKDKARDAEIEKLKADNATLFQNIADFNVDIAEIDNKGDLDVATAYADAQKYGYDKEAGWRTDVANIEVKGKLDLQPIINAGLKAVADVEAGAARDVAETTGKYSLQSMQARSEADKSIGKMQLAGGMYGLLGAAFG